MNIGREKPCRKGCCWTPFGTCAKSGDCVCHMGSQLREDMAVGILLGIGLDEVERRRKLRAAPAPAANPKRWKTEDGKWTRRKPL